MGRNLIVIFLILIPFLGHSQEISLSVFQGQGFATSLGTEWFSNGPGLQLRYQGVLDKADFWNIGIEARSLNWGNQVGVVTGYERRYAKSWEKWSFSLGGEMMNGIALFRTRSLYSLSLVGGHRIKYQTNGRSFFQLNTGVGYNTAPRYAAYGFISNSYELRLGISYGLRL